MWHSCWRCSAIIYFISYYQTGQYLFENYAFLIMTMLNCDRVYCGHYRLDSLSNDENRIYNRFMKFPKFNGPIVVLKIFKNHKVAFYIEICSQFAKQSLYLYKLTLQHINSSCYFSILLGYLQEFQKQITPKVHHFRKKYLCSLKLIINKINMELKEKEENIQKALESKIQYAKENLVPQAMTVHYTYSINPYLTGVAKTHVYLTKQSYVQLYNRSQLQILQVIGYF